MIRSGFLDPQSRRDLIELTRDGSVAHRLARRANALVLLDQGMSCRDVAKVLFLDDDTIRTWYRLYQEDGFEGLAKFGYEGSACRLSDQQQAKLKAWITATLPRTTCAIGAWVEKEFGITYAGLAGTAGVPDQAALHPIYCPHLDPIERLWGLMHQHVTHNRCHETFADFKAAILTFLREEVPRKWKPQLASELVPARAVDSQDAVRPGCDQGAGFLQMEVHGVGVGMWQDQASADPPVLGRPPRKGTPTGSAGLAAPWGGFRARPRRSSDCLADRLWPHPYMRVQLSTCGVGRLFSFVAGIFVA